MYGMTSILLTARDGGVTQMIEYLLSKHETLSSNPGTAKKKGWKEGRKEERKEGNERRKEKKYL
jgi:hypothetical protein